MSRDDSQSSETADSREEGVESSNFLSCGGHKVATRTHSAPDLRILRQTQDFSDSKSDIVGADSEVAQPQVGPRFKFKMHVQRFPPPMGF